MICNWLDMRYLLSLVTGAAFPPPTSLRLSGVNLTLVWDLEIAEASLGISPQFLVYQCGTHRMKFTLGDPITNEVTAGREEWMNRVLVGCPLPPRDSYLLWQGVYDPLETNKTIHSAIKALT